MNLAQEPLHHSSENHVSQLAPSAFGEEHRQVVQNEYFQLPLFDTGEDPGRGRVQCSGQDKACALQGRGQP